MVRDKVEICDSLLSSFTAFQGVGKFALYNKAKYAALAEIIEQEADTHYQHFFSQPVENWDKLTWYATPFKENPRRLSELSDNDQQHYTEIKKETLNHFHELINKLNSRGDLERLEFIEKALKFVSDDFIYCYDNKVVLTAWGMKPKPNIHTSTGEYIIDVFAAKKEKPKVTITFDAGRNGTINGERYYNIILEKDSFLSKDVIPTIDVSEGYEFENWSANEFINGSSPITEDIVITANYSEINKKNPPPKEPTQPSPPPQPPKRYTVTFSSYLDGKKQEEIKSEFEEDHSISAAEIPFTDDQNKRKFTGWDTNPEDFKVNKNLHFRADYETKLSWWKRWWNWLMSKGCLTWLLRALIVALIIALILYLWRSCEGHNQNINHSARDVIKDSITNNELDKYNYIDKDQWILDDTNPDQKHGVYNKDPKTQLPVNPRVIIPFEEDEIVESEDGIRNIISGRLSGIISKEKSIFEFAKQFKNDFPSDEYEIIYFDTLLNRVQFMFPESNRNSFKSKLTEKYNEYDLFIWDESLFETGKISDPAYQNFRKRWHLDAIQAEQAWNVTMGSKDVIVAVVDNGFDLNHEEFKGKIVRPYNVLTKSKNITKSKDNHGTHVAAIAIGNSNNKGLLGVAPKCSFMPVQVSYESNYISISAVLDGVLYALYQGADVINLSIALSFAENAKDISINKQRQLIQNHFKEEERLWSKIFELASSKNAVLVVAAGNDNMLAGIDPIQRSNTAIIVSAVDKNNKGVFKSDFSNFGKYTTVSAPGVNIYSALDNNKYGKLDGTSMAAPIVAGAVALMKSKNKNYTPDQIRNLMLDNAKPIGNKIGPLLQLGKLINPKGAENNTNETIAECCQDCEIIKNEIDSLTKVLKKKKENCP